MIAERYKRAKFKEGRRVERQKILETARRLEREGKVLSVEELERAVNGEEAES